MTETFTTEVDVALDLAAALDMYHGLFGSECTSIESVDTALIDAPRWNRVIVTLSNGDQYEIRVERVQS